MPVIDLSAYKPVPATLGDANQIANGMQAIQNTINGLDNLNFAAGKIFDPAKLMQDAAVDGDALVWDNTNSKWVPASAMPATSPKPGLYKLWDSTDAGVSFPAASIVTPTLPQTFKHLRVDVSARSNGAVTSTSFQVRFNGDAGANYEWLYTQTDNTAAVTGSAASGVTVIAAPGIPGATAVAGRFGVISFTIPVYADTVTHKGVLGLNYFDTDVGIAQRSWGAVWRSAAAITTLTFFPASGSLITGTRITVYGEA